MSLVTLPLFMYWTFSTLINSFILYSHVYDIIELSPFILYSYVRMLYLHGSNIVLLPYYVGNRIYLFSSYVSLLNYCNKYKLC